MQVLRSTSWGLVAVRGTQWEGFCSSSRVQSNLPLFHLVYMGLKPFRQLACPKTRCARQCRSEPSVSVAFNSFPSQRAVRADLNPLRLGEPSLGRLAFAAAGHEYTLQHPCLLVFYRAGMFQAFYYSDLTLQSLVYAQSSASSKRHVPRERKVDRFLAISIPSK